jgi:predicted ATPase
LYYAELERERVPSFDAYPFNLPIIKDLETVEFHPQVTFLVGDNGTGKSTLLEAVAVSVGLNPEGGSRNFNFATRESHSKLYECLTVAKGPLAWDAYFLRAESFYNVASQVDDLYRGESLPLQLSYGGSLHEKSHGESFFALFKIRFAGDGLYFIDEPEAALSPQRQIEFLCILNKYCQRGAQFLIATHSPIIMAYPNSWIYHCSAKGLQRMKYEDTEHFLITRGFLANPERTLKELFAEEESTEPDSPDSLFA